MANHLELEMSAYHCKGPLNSRFSQYLASILACTRFSCCSTDGTNPADSLITAARTDVLTHNQMSTCHLIVEHSCV